MELCYVPNLRETAAGLAPMSLRDYLMLPETRALRGLDGPEATLLHARIIQAKPFLHRLYQDFYAEFITAARAGPGGRCVELGSGGGFLKRLLPHVITSDVQPLPDVDEAFSVERMPFANASVQMFFLLGTFHHFPDAAAALREMARCLRPGGQVVMIEPANTPWGRFIYRRFHHEPFDPSGGWSFPSDGPLSGANGALPWIVFCRDRERLARDFPELRLVSVRCHTPLRYLLSGGVSMRCLVPSFSYPLAKAADAVLGLAGALTGMFMTVKLEREK